MKGSNFYLSLLGGVDAVSIAGIDVGHNFWLRRFTSPARSAVVAQEVLAQSPSSAGAGDMAIVEKCSISRAQRRAISLSDT